VHRRVEPFFGLGPASIGAPGDNNHLYGRHRSANWDRTSIYCTNRSYGTTDARDKRGDQNWYRAIDVGITGQKLYDACHRVDSLVRSGQLPGLAEWFGTFDGKTVVGWYEGHASSSDSSHLTHFHGGFWNESADDADTMRLVYGALTGEGDDMTPEQDRLLKECHQAFWNGGGSLGRITDEPWPDTVGNAIAQKLDAMWAVIDEIKANQGNVTVVITEAQIAAAVRKELDKTKLGT